MDISFIIRCLEDISRIGNEGKRSLQYIRDCVASSKIILHELHNNVKLKKMPESLISFSEFWIHFENSLQNDALIEDERLICAINTLYLLHLILVLHKEINTDDASSLEIQSASENTLDGNTSQSIKGINNEKTIKAILSLQNFKVIQNSVKFIMYTSVLACLPNDSSIFMKTKIVKEKLVFGGNLIQIPGPSCHQFLKLNLKYLLPILKDEDLGEGLRSNLLGEFLCPLLLLCFSPTTLREFPEDVEHFRAELEYIFNNYNPSNILEFFIIQKTLLSQNSSGQSWMKSACNSLFIRRFLFRHNGVAMVIQTSIKIMSVEDWRKKEAIAFIISSTKFSNEIVFYEKIGPQVVSLTKQKNTDVIHILAFLISQLNKRSNKLTNIYIFQPIIRPLFLLTEENIEEDDIDLVENVCVLNHLYVEVMPPSLEIRLFVEPIIHPLFRVATLPPTCHVKTKAILILIRFLSQLDITEIITTLLGLSGLEGNSSSPPINPRITLVPEMNKIRIDRKVSNTSNDTLLEEETPKCIVDILEKLKNSKATKEFYIKLFHYIDFTVLNHVNVPKNFLLTDDDVEEIKLTKVKKLTIATSLLSLISSHEELSKDLFMDLYGAVPFIENLLKIGNQHCEDEGLLQTKNSLLLNSVMLISFYVSDRILLKKMTYSDWEGLKSLLPSLEGLKTCCGNPAIIEFIEQLRTTILTHGTVNFSKESVDSETSYAPNTEDSTRSFNEASTYDEALVDICSPHLPVRGHAILTLTKLLSEKDKKTIANRDKILALFEHNLKDEDSYVYLMAVQGLVALADSYPDKIVSILTSEISKGNQTIETKLKMIEVLTRVTKLLGPLLPKYKNIFINTLLNGTHDEDDLVRASCLSNLGEVCKELRFSIGPIVQEIFSIVYHIIKFDKSSMIKCSAVQVITLLLQGLGKDAIYILKDVLLEIYRELKQLVITQNDQILILHTQLALEELNSITKDFITPSKTLEKKIYVSEIPPTL